MNPTPSTPLYKVLGRDGRSIHGGSAQWILPTVADDGTWAPGEWMPEITGQLQLCMRGYHLTDESGVWKHWMAKDAVAWEAEAVGDRVGTLTDDDSRKTAVRRARLLRPMPEPDWWVATKRFIRDDIPAVPCFRPDGNPDPSWRLFTESSWGAAWGAARDAAWGAAWGAARDAAWDAELFAAAAVALPGDDTHRIHAAARWNVWIKGYALLCDVDDVLYVYAGPSRPLPAAGDTPNG